LHVGSRQNGEQHTKSKIKRPAVDETNNLICVRLRCAVESDGDGSKRVYFAPFKKE
jgi:hypothetical protein